MEIEDMVAVCHANRTNIDLLHDDSGDNDEPYGVRLRFYGNPTLDKKMVLASGRTVADALYAAILKAKDSRFEPLNFKARPWLQDAKDLPFTW